MGLTKVSQQLAMCMITCITRILVKVVLGIHVLLGFMWGGRLAYKGKDWCAA